MKAKLQFFMLVDDSESFLAFAKRHVDQIEADEGVSAVSQFIIGDCEIHFKASSLIGDTLTAGYIQIDSGGIDDGCQAQNRANTVYRKLRKWIKKDAFSRLSTWMEGNESKLSRERNYYVAPAAKQWLSADGQRQRVLKLSVESVRCFGLAPEVSEMGSIVPKDEKFKFRGR